MSAGKVLKSPQGGGHARLAVDEKYENKEMYPQFWPFLRETWFSKPKFGCSHTFSEKNTCVQWRIHFVVGGNRKDRMFPPTVGQQTFWCAIRLDKLCFCNRHLKMNPTESKRIPCIGIKHLRLNWSHVGHNSLSHLGWHSKWDIHALCVNHGQEWFLHILSFCTSKTYRTGSKS